MGGFTVDLEAMQAAAKAVAAGLRAAGPAESVAGIGAAIPGGAAQQSGDQLSTTWNAGVAATADAVDGYGARLISSATEYQQVEQAVSGTLGGG